MENKDRIKALNILFTATWISILITAVLTPILSTIAEKYYDNPNGAFVAIIIGPVTTYIAGRIMCFKEYED